MKKTERKIFLSDGGINFLSDSGETEGQIFDIFVEHLL